MMHHRRFRRTARAMPVAVAALATAGLTAVTAPAPSAAAGTARATATDRALVREMVPHHKMAVEMGQVAEMDGEHAKIRTLAKSIVTAQKAEIRDLTAIARRLGVRPARMPMHGHMTAQMMRDLRTLGVTERQSGMTMDMHELHGAKPLDRVFIDMMIPHHQGAIRMARAELKNGKNAQLRRAARLIVTDQAKEIRRMNSWREQWYGATSPAGVVPKP